MKGPDDDIGDLIDALAVTGSAFRTAAADVAAAFGPREPRFGAWSVSDVLAHLIAWDTEAIRRWGEIRDGAEGDIAYDVEAFNAEATSTRRNASWEELMSEHRRSHAELLDQARLQTARVRQDRRFSEWITALRDHYVVHTKRLEEKLTDSSAGSP